MTTQICAVSSAEKGSHSDTLLRRRKTSSVFYARITYQTDIKVFLYDRGFLQQFSVHDIF